MKITIKKCPACSNYTLRDICPKCRVKTIDPRPPKFSPQDKYGAYRRKMKEEIKKKEMV